MKQRNLLLLLFVPALWAQPRPPKAPAPPSPSIDIDLPDLPRFDHLKDLDWRLEKLERFSIDVAANVNLKVADAMSRAGMTMPMAYASGALFSGHTTGQERSYERGVRALDGRHYEEALEAFSQAAATPGARAAGALYGRAYALHRLNRRDEALAALAELRKASAANRWAGDAEALEHEIKQGSGPKSAAERDSEEDLKVLALAGLMRSSPEKADAMLEQIVKGSSSRKLQEQALRVLARGDNQRSRDLLSRIARGQAGSPDLQLRAVRLLAGRREDNKALLREVYGSAADEQVKRAALRALGSGENKDEVLRIARSEKDVTLRKEAVSMLGRSVSSTELWPLFQNETAVEVKETLLHRMSELGATDRLLEVARTGKELKLRQAAIRGLGSVTTGDALVAMYATETDAAIRRAIIDSLYGNKNGKALVTLARGNTDPQTKRDIVSRLARMNTPEATSYLAEILK